MLLFIIILILKYFGRFKNRPNINFDDVTVEADDEFEMQPDLTGTLEYPIK